MLYHYVVVHFPLRGSAKCRLGNLHFFNVAVLLVAAKSTSGEQHSCCVEDSHVGGMYVVKAYLR